MFYHTVEDVNLNIAKTWITTTNNTATMWIEAPVATDEEEYNRGLQERQKRHLDGICNPHSAPWMPCMHDSCPQCVGTGIKGDGSICVHCISCPCPKCTPSL